MHRVFPSPSFSLRLPLSSPPIRRSTTDQVITSAEHTSSGNRRIRLFVRAFGTSLYYLNIQLVFFSNCRGSEDAFPVVVSICVYIYIILSLFLSSCFWASSGDRVAFTLLYSPPSVDVSYHPFFFYSITSLLVFSVPFQRAHSPTRRKHFSFCLLFL